MKTIAPRMHLLQENFFAALDRQIRTIQETGADLIRLDVGSPDLPPPPPVLEALRAAAWLPSSHGYQSHSPREVRRAWAALYASQSGVALDPEQELLPLLGSKEGIFHLTQAMVGPGDAVLIPDPSYLTYTQAALFAGGEPFPLPLRAERGFLPDLEAVPAGVLARAKLLWLNYPNNPTAAVADLEFFSTAVDFARRHNLLVCHDAAYTQVTFAGCRAPSLLEVPGACEVAVEFNTLSKSHNMAGWRVGVLAGKREVIQALSLLKANVDSGHFYPILQAAIQAMTGDQTWIVERNEVYRQRRDAALAVLAQYGCRLDPPAGSLYLWCPVPPGWTSNDFVRRVLEEAHVSLTPGPVFGSQGEGYYRVSLTLPQERIEEAFHRIGRVLQAAERRPA